MKWFIPDEFAGPEDVTVDAMGDLREDRREGENGVLVELPVQSHIRSHPPKHGELVRALRVHRRLPELLGAHLAQALEARDLP